MSLSPSLVPAHAPPPRGPNFYRNTNLTVSSGDIIEADLVQEASASRGRTYPPSGIISYAQNHEDVLLWRALFDIEDGFYVDTGVQDPTVDSVTRAFYDRGWRGINIEPVTGYFDKLCRERPRDLTLHVAVGDRFGLSTLYEFPNSGLSTLVEEIAFGHRARGLRDVQRRVPIVTLASVWAKFVTGEVHFLKIDVEGYERQVLSGMDLVNFRPWIILVEATQPATSVAISEEWEQILLGARYELVHFDGLNCWYLAEERSKLKPRFEAPPNIFDQFELASTVSLREDLAAVKRDLERMRASASWRWTAPLRAARDGFCKLMKKLR